MEIDKPLLSVTAFGRLGDRVVTKRLLIEYSSRDALSDAVVWEEPLVPDDLVNTMIDAMKTWVPGLNRDGEITEDAPR